MQAEAQAEQTWTLEDPVSGRYFCMGETEALLVEGLRAGQLPSAALQAVAARTLKAPSPGELKIFLQQLRSAGLCRASAGLPPVVARTPPGFWTRVLHGYVYYRIPLLRPDTWVTRLAPWVKPLASASLARVLRYIGVLALVLAIPQAELYFATASYLLTPGGFASFIGSLVALKVGHELAHAFSAKFKRLHIRSMGVAFILLWPVLYTDVTDAWREPDRRRRAQIGSAGIRFELAIASLALLLWSLLPDGVLRSLAFYLSSASILSTLFINLNPFMRFDGYYLLMDVWGIDNLQPRAFALLRHRLRRFFLGWRGQAPEAPPQAGWMCVYAGLTVLYRILIAIGIAAAVFAMLGAVAGLVVASLELYIMLLRPVLREVTELYRQRALIGSHPRALASLVAISLGCVALALPLERSLLVPAALSHERLQYVSSPFAGRIVTLPPPAGTRIKAGQVLLVVDSLEHQHELDRLELALRRNRAERQALSTRGSEGGYRRWLEEDERRLLSAQAGAQSRLTQRVLRASADGELLERDTTYRVGDTVASDQVLATVRQSPRLRVAAFLDDRDGARMHLDALTHARLRPWDTGLPTLTVGIVNAQLSTAPAPPSFALYDRFGGPMAAVLATSSSSPTSASSSAAHTGQMQQAPALRARDAYQVISFSVDLPAITTRIPDATPAWVELQLQPISFIGQLLDFLARTLSK